MRGIRLCEQQLSRGCVLAVFFLTVFNSCHLEIFRHEKPGTLQPGAESFSGTTYSNYRGLYVDSTSYILGDTSRENSLLRWCQYYQINTLSLYDLPKVMTSKKAGDLARFLKLGKTNYGIKEITAVTGSYDFISTYLDTFNRSKPDTLQRFNAVNLEREWWNVNHGFRSYANILNKVNHWGQSQVPPLKVEEYIGWFLKPSRKELYMAGTLIENSDRILVHAYQKNLSFQYVQSRLSYLGQAAQRKGKIFPVIIIFSAEPGFSADYFRTHSFEDAYQIILDGYLKTDFPGKQNVKLIGFQVFDYSYVNRIKP